MRGRMTAIGVACAAVSIGAMPAAAGAATKTVYPGGPVKWQNQLLKKYGAEANNYLINRVTINVGDTVVWSGKSLANGFHTVDIPAKGGTDQPLILPTGKKVIGIDDFAGNPFWFNGQPQLTLNPALFTASGGNTYNGSSRVDSGLPVSGPKDFKVKFTKPGVYKYFCDVHYGMVGYVVVRAKGKAVPNAAQDKASLAAQENSYVVIAKKVDKTTTKGANVSVGASGPGGLDVLAMFPAKLTVKSGTTVTFSMSKLTRETHTVTFGDTSAPNGYVYKLGQTAFNQPDGSIEAIGAYPSSVPMPIRLTPASHGNGFANTGALDRDSSTPLPASAKITFAQKGTYHFICLIHSFMHGTIVVK